MMPAKQIVLICAGGPERFSSSGSLQQYGPGEAWGGAVPSRLQTRLRKRAFALRGLREGILGVYAVRA